MIDYNKLNIHQFSDRTMVSWNEAGTIANVHFPTGDGTAIVLTMTAETLKAVRADIDEALAHKPRATPDR